MELAWGNAAPTPTRTLWRLPPPPSPSRRHPHQPPRLLRPCSPLLPLPLARAPPHPAPAPPPLRPPSRVSLLGQLASVRDLRVRLRPSGCDLPRSAGRIYLIGTWVILSSADFAASAPLAHPRAHCSPHRSVHCALPHACTTRPLARDSHLPCGRSTTAQCQLVHAPARRWHSHPCARANSHGALTRAHAGDVRNIFLVSGGAGVRAGLFGVVGRGRWASLGCAPG